MCAKQQLVILLLSALVPRSVPLVPLVPPLTSVTCDVVVFGTTPAGITASIAAAHHGAHTCLFGPANRVGGMMSGGLGWDDVTPSSMAAAAGLKSLEDSLSAVYGSGAYTTFRTAIYQHYEEVSAQAASLSASGTKHEPHVAENVFTSMLKDAGVTVQLGAELLSVINSPNDMDQHMDNATAIASLRLTLQNGTDLDVLGHSFIDATYEGDLLAKAGAPFRMGREGRREYGEVNAGVVFQSSSHTFLRGSTGSASPLLPAMTWRLCFSNNASNRVVLKEPPYGYNRTKYLGYVEDVAAGRMSSVWGAWSGTRALPPTGDKFDINCNPRPLGFIWAGPQKEQLINASGRARSQLVEELRNLTLGLLWFQRTLFCLQLLNPNTSVDCRA